MLGVLSSGYGIAIMNTQNKSSGYLHKSPHPLHKYIRARAAGWEGKGGQQECEGRREGSEGI